MSSSENAKILMNYGANVDIGERHAFRVAYS